MTEKRFTIAVYDDKAVNGFTVLDLQKPNNSKRLKYENVYIGSKVGCEIVCNFGNNLADENEQLKKQIEDLYESDKSLRKFASNMTLNYTGICVPRRLFVEVITILKDIGHNDLVEDLSKESIDTIANGC